MRNPVLNTGWRLFSSRLGIEPKTPWWLVQAQPLAQRGSGAHPGRGFVLLVYFPNTETMSPYLENTPEKRSLFDTHAVKDGKGQGPKCHTLALSHLEPGRAPTVSMPAAVRPPCILHARDLGMLAIFSDRFWGGAEGLLRKHVTPREQDTRRELLRTRASAKHLAEIRKWRVRSRGFCGCPGGDSALRVDAPAATRPQPVIKHIQRKHGAGRCGPGRYCGRPA